MDAETGLYYFKHRFYDPAIGRFLTEDPVEGENDNPPSLHRYLYAFGNPTVYTDPDGKEGEEVRWASVAEIPEGAQYYAVQTNRGGTAYFNANPNAWQDAHEDISWATARSLASGNVQIKEEKGFVDRAKEGFAGIFLDRPVALATSLADLNNTIDSGLKRERLGDTDDEGA